MWKIMLEIKGLLSIMNGCLEGRSESRTLGTELSGSFWDGKAVIITLFISVIHLIFISSLVH